MEDVIEGNKLIAEFMGIDVKNSVELFILEHERLVKFKTTDGTFVSAIFKFNELNYHSSWDWLMPVCIKLGMEFVNTNIVLTYNNVIDGIRSLEGNKRL